MEFYIQPRVFSRALFTVTRVHQLPCLVFPGALPQLPPLSDQLWQEGTQEALVILLLAWGKILKLSTHQMARYGCCQLWWPDLCL